MCHPPAPRLLPIVLRRKPDRLYGLPGRMPWQTVTLPRKYVPPQYHAVVTTGRGGESTCMYKNTGQILWVKNVGGSSYPTPPIDNNTVFVGDW